MVMSVDTRITTWTLDLELGRSKKHLEKHNIIFQPAVNEELAATAAWGPKCSVIRQT